MAGARGIGRRGGSWVGGGAAAAAAESRSRRHVKRTRGDQGGASISGRCSSAAEEGPGKRPPSLAPEGGGESQHLAEWRELGGRRSGGSWVAAAAAAHARPCRVEELVEEE